jgi:hypothetical protein
MLQGILTLRAYLSTIISVLITLYYLMLADVYLQRIFHNRRPHPIFLHERTTIHVISMKQEREEHIK